MPPTHFSGPCESGWVGSGRMLRVMPTDHALPEIWRLTAQHHAALKGFAAMHGGNWTLAIRRTAWLGLAVLAATLRRLIHLLAMDIVLAPIRARDDSAPLPPLAPEIVAPRRPALRFRLIETPRARRPRAPNPDRVPDPPEFNHALFLDRLAVLAEVYRARARFARRLARRVQSRRAPLRRPPLPKRLYVRAPQAFTQLLANLDSLLAAPDSS